VEFSRPNKVKPIPEGTVKVDFYVVDNTENESDAPNYDVEFNFENESLRHSLKYTMRKNMFEKWID
jgi:hypothetical protein